MISDHAFSIPADTPRLAREPKTVEQIYDRSCHVADKLGITGDDLIATCNQLRADGTDAYSWFWGKGND